MKLRARFFDGLELVGGDGRYLRVVAPRWWELRRWWALWRAPERGRVDVSAAGGTVKVHVVAVAPRRARRNLRA